MKHRIRTGIFASLGMLLLILDTKTAIQGAQEGIRLCIMTVIPSLFPFFVLSSLLTGALTGVRLRFLRPIGKLCRMPAGSESLLLIGMLGGYPTGAKSAADAYQNGQLSRSSANWLLAFCNNAGPSFLFGIIAPQFTNGIAAWALWGIHIFSCLAVGALMPGGEGSQRIQLPHKPFSVTQALERSVAVMGRVCGWILLFRVIIAFCRRWFLWLFSEDLQVILSGCLELTIGCTSLSQIRGEGLRFVVCAAFLGFGGLCVTMQTLSVIGDLSATSYLNGKLLQCGISVILALIVQNFLFSALDRVSFSAPILLILGILLAAAVYALRKSEKRYSNPAVIGV